jgi:hypothetical protein
MLISPFDVIGICSSSGQLLDAGLAFTSFFWGLSKEFFCWYFEGIFFHNKKICQFSGVRGFKKSDGLFPLSNNF